MDFSLTALLALPILAALIIGLIPQDKAARGIAIAVSAVMLVLSGFLLLNFKSTQGFQFEMRLPWVMQPVPVQYHVGIDGMSLSLVVLTTIVTLAAVLASKNIGENRPRLYYSMVMLLTASILGTFCSLDLLQFFVFWELELAPMYFLIAIWGGPNRSYAAMKFLLYTFFGGIFMLAGLLYLYINLGTHGLVQTFDMATLVSYTTKLPIKVQALAFLGFMLAFLIKLPSFPFHTWLPDAHVEAPTPISMILAGLLLKMGSYGMVRIGLGFFPAVIAGHQLQVGPFVGAVGAWLMALGCFNVVWGALACLVQTDMKRVIALSSVSHMGFILMGLGSLSAAALSGTIFQMVSHGFISAALFFLVGVIYDRCHTRDIEEIGGGLAKQMPTAFYFWLLAALANLGLPALAGFVAEATIYYGSYASPMANAYPQALHAWIIVSCLGVILSAGYMLWLLRRIFYGPENPRWVGHLSDMTLLERRVGVILSVFIVLLGVVPMTLTHLYVNVADSLTADAAAHLPTISMNRTSLTK